jgi:hypothetical protein
MATPGATPITHVQAPDVGQAMKNTAAAENTKLARKNSRRIFAAISAEAFAMKSCLNYSSQSFVLWDAMIAAQRLNRITIQQPEEPS